MKSEKSIKRETRSYPCQESERANTNAKANPAASFNIHSTITPAQPQEPAFALELQVGLVFKRGAKTVIIGYLVDARPMDKFVFAQTYQRRWEVQRLSIPDAVLTYVREHHASYWLVRVNEGSLTYKLPLRCVEKVGTLKRSGGSREWVVDLERFEPIEWQKLPFTPCVEPVRDTSRLRSQSRSRQAVSMRCQ